MKILDQIQMIYFDFHISSTIPYSNMESVYQPSTYGKFSLIHGIYLCSLETQFDKDNFQTKTKKNPQI